MQRIVHPEVPAAPVASTPGTPACSPLTTVTCLAPGFPWTLVAGKGRVGWRLADVGWPFTRLLSEGVGIPIVDSRCRFDRRILLDDMITIETSVGGIGTTSFRSRHRFLRDDELCAEGELVHVCIERAGRTPVPVPDWIRGAAAPD